ncbi:hypothetical protein Z517_09344 [Fonsecaea pedrosoi CBS 271.37]|uniref:Uncharacterized protein n=1 Tax=Fonsecaea pedrosoi CBS 271.37 TaxID=1442368 RepID=A0A0D2GE28_9EURO|nr:uncharacterized protein Z517_09344 [Fonsecaea pedrosoi CBS 271.37]KIW76900.1 hypothetical protein Z517_09344 [Fonsecaea pedrosoi CBS 271.37]
MSYSTWARSLLTRDELHAAVDEQAAEADEPHGDDSLMNALGVPNTLNSVRDNHCNSHCNSYCDKSAASSCCKLGTFSSPVSSHDPTMSPPLYPAYPMPMSDSLSPGPMMPGSELASPHSPSPSQMYAVPAYSSGVPQSINGTPVHSIYNAPRLSRGGSCS